MWETIPSKPSRDYIYTYMRDCFYVYTEDFIDMRDYTDYIYIHTLG